MQGEIGVESHPESGSTFWFTINFTASDTTPQPDLESTTPITNSSSAKTLKILVVEDYPDNRDVVVFMLEELGYQPQAVNDGQQALDKLALEDFDIVLMDCQGFPLKFFSSKKILMGARQMPVLDGYEATRQLRQRQGTQRHTTIIGLTANAMYDDREKCLAAGMDDYLSKPVMIEDLEQILRKFEE